MLRVTSSLCICDEVSLLLTFYAEPLCLSQVSVTRDCARHALDMIADLYLLCNSSKEISYDGEDYASYKPGSHTYRA